MFNKMKSLWNLFRIGQAVADKRFFAQTQSVALPVLVSLVVAGVQLAATFEVSLPIDETMATYIAGAIYFVVNIVLSIITSEHLGLPATKIPEPKAIPDEPQEIISERFDVDTMQRAKEWLAQNKKA